MELLPYISGFSNSLPVFLLSGVVHIPSPNKHFQRISQNWIIYIITDGIMQIMENENQYTLTAGDIMIFSPGKCHYGLLTNEHIDYYYIHFDWNCLQDITMTSEEYLQQKVGGHPFCPTPSSTVQNTFLLPKYFHPTHSDFEKIIRQMQHLANFNSTNGLHQQSINDALLFVLLLQMSRSELSHILNTEQENLSLPFRICDYLKNNYSHKITGSMLEDIFHHNFDYMNRRFKQHTGTTIFAFLENLRIEQGKKLLKSRQFTISETAEALGFCNAFYFSRVFKKHEAITPSEYQQKHSV